MRKNNTTKNPIVDKVCLGAVLGIFGLVAVLNLVQPNRPTVSEAEKRTLTPMPEFSLSSLADGSYFSDLSLFISDTFIARDSLVGASKKLDTLRGANFSVDGEGDFALIHTSGGQKSDEDADEDLSSKLAEALDTLNRQDLSEDDAPEAHTPDDEPIDVDPTDDEPTDDEPIGDEPSEDEPIVGERETLLANGDISEILSGNGGDGTGVEGISISKESMNLTVGSGAFLKASVETKERGASVVWSVTDSKVAEIAVNQNGGVDVKAVGTGTCYVMCKSGAKETMCEVNVTAINSVTSTQNADDADFLANGLFIYGDAVYTPSGYSPSVAKTYADTALYYKNLFGNVTMSVVVAPVSSMVIDNPKITSQIPNQQSALANMAALCDPSVNFVDTYSEMFAHKDEYLFFKTDHHWTQRGAYYAYVAFAKSRGFTPTPLEDFDYVLKNEDYHGSMYSYTQDERVRNFSDDVEAFISKKQHTMTVTTPQGGTITYDSSVVSFNNTYVAFIAGDNPYTVINVPENPQDMNVLVLKDSFGNAFVPFLCEHYGNIFVVDTRYSSFNIYDQLAGYGITDIIFVNNIQAANSPAWSRLYLGAVGVQ